MTIEEAIDLIKEILIYFETYKDDKKYNREVGRAIEILLKEYEEVKSELYEANNRINDLLETAEEKDNRTKSKTIIEAVKYLEENITKNDMVFSQWFEDMERDEEEQIRNSIEILIKEYKKLEEHQIWSEATVEGLKRDFIHKDTLKEIIYGDYENLEIILRIKELIDEK